MSGNLNLLALDRDDGERRLVVRWIEFPGGSHAIELAVERRTSEGWRLAKRIVVRLSEVFSVGDAIERACALARTVKR